jgi:hypothetical protein
VNAAAHYERAEQLLELAAAAPSENDETNPAAALLIAEAQVHAALAQSAVFVSVLRDDLTAEQIDQWATAGVL